MSNFEAEVRQLLGDINRKLDAILKARPAGSNGSANGRLQPASDADLDGQYGDPAVKFNPKKWEGENYVGCAYSMTEPAFLEVLAESLEWSSNNPKPGKEKYAAYDRKDAARALGWAQRLRRQGVAAPLPAAEPPPDYTNDEDIPF